MATNFIFPQITQISQIFSGRQERGIGICFSHYEKNGIKSWFFITIFARSVHIPIKYLREGL